MSVEISKMPSRLKTTNVKRQTKKNEKTGRQEATSTKSIAGANQDGSLLPGVFFSSAEVICIKNILGSFTDGNFNAHLSSK